MPQIMPIRGLRYTATAGDPASLLAPPYDVITPAQRDAIAARSPHNAVHLELAAGGEERYARVADLIAAWVRDGILARDQEPSYYVYQQEFREEGVEHRRTALIAGVEAQPWEEGAVRPHEQTMSGPKEDRLRLLEATGTQISPLFMVARDRAGQLRGFLDETTAAGEPAFVAGIEGGEGGETHRLWPVEASRYEARQLAPLLSETFYIADGHHRYETAVNYKLARIRRDGTLPRDHPARFAMTAIVPAEDPGLIIRPIHRVVSAPVPADWRERLGRVFDVQPFAPGPDSTACTGALAADPGLMLAAGFEPGTVLALRLHDEDAYRALAPGGHSTLWTNLVVHLCRYGILEPLFGIADAELVAGAVRFDHDAAAVLDGVANGEATAAILLPPVLLDDVLTLSDQDERLPQKSTFFHPKMGTGLVFHPLRE